MDEAQFELGERDVIDKPKAMTAIMQHWQTQHEREVYLKSAISRTRAAI